MNIFVGLIIVVYIYFVSILCNNCLDVQLHSAHPKTLEIAGSKSFTERSVLNLSAPEILQRPAPQPGAPLFGAPRPERPSAPANPDLSCIAGPRGLITGGELLLARVCALVCLDVLVLCVCAEVWGVGLDVCERMCAKVGPLIQGRAPGPFSCTLLKSLVPY